MTTPLKQISKPMEVVWKDKKVLIGGGYPVVVQSMTNTNTEDPEATFNQVLELARAGSELVRITVNTPAAAAAVPKIRRLLDEAGCFVPLIGDFHYNGHKLLTDYPECAECLSKYRINPGNVGKGSKHDDNFATLIELAKKYNKPIRIGVNWGSLDQDLLNAMLEENRNSAEPEEEDVVLKKALVRSAVESADQAVRLGMPKHQVAISAKVSGVRELVEVYRRLKSACRYHLHLGLTEAGLGLKGTVATASALSILLAEGIGDTIRVSLTPVPGHPRTEEVTLAWEILQALNLRSFEPRVISCPGCGRTSSSFFQVLAKEIQDFLGKKMEDWKGRYPGVETMTVAVMGCVVNGPGESRHADIGIALPGRGENPVAPIFANGRKIGSVKGEGMVEEFKKIIEEYVKDRYGSKQG